MFGIKHNEDAKKFFFLGGGGRRVGKVTAAILDFMVRSKVPIFFILMAITLSPEAKPAP